MRNVHEAIPEIVDRLASGDTLDPLRKLIFREHVDDFWKPYLTITEYSVLSYIVRRTVHFGRVWFTASISNILNGAGGWPGIGVSRRTYFSTMNSLEDKGMVVRKHLANGRCTVIINAEWDPSNYGIAMEPERQKPLRESHKETNSSVPSAGDAPSRAADAPRQCAIRTLNTYNKNTSSKESYSIGDAAAEATSPRLIMPKDKINDEASSDKEESVDLFGVSKKGQDGEGLVQPVAIIVRQRHSYREAKMRAKTFQHLEDM